MSANSKGPSLDRSPPFPIMQLAVKRYQYSFWSEGFFVSRCRYKIPGIKLWKERKTAPLLAMIAFPCKTGKGMDGFKEKTIRQNDS